MKRLSLVAILLLGFLTRAYQYQDRFIYAHDSDLASWVVKDILIDHHPRLIGQLTSTPGIFIGSLFYYSLIPFYLITGMDPIGSVAFSWIVGLVAIASIFWVFNRLSGSRTGIIAALIYAVSFAISLTEREVVPTTPVMLWSIWFFYALHRLYQGHRSSLMILAVLTALIWHLNLGLALLIPLVVLGIAIRIKQYQLKDFLKPLLVLVLLSLPLLIFEFRHGFQQTKALFVSLTPTLTSTPASPKFSHTASYIAKNASDIFWWNYSSRFSEYIIPGILLLGFIWLLFTRKVPRLYALVLPLWLISYWIFFSLHPINLSEYYLNGLNIIWISLAALILNQLFWLTPIILCIFLYLNLSVFFSFRTPANGYIQKKQLVKYISQDSRLHDFPCVSVSYITTAGYNLGYRYFFWLENLHVNQPQSGSPVYTIVFPQSLVDHFDVSFGSLGLILPDYERYSPQAVKLSCVGENHNLTDPMFGFTK
jgi:hypothetical protein